MLWYNRIETIRNARETIAEYAREVVEEVAEEAVSNALTVELTGMADT